MTGQTLLTMRELDRRTNNGIHVRLLSCAGGDRLMVAVLDQRTGDAFSLNVREGERPTDVFTHPYAYAAWHGVRTGAPTVTAVAPESLAA